MTVTLTIQLFSTLSLLAFWVWTRRRDRREVSRLVNELAACRSTLHEFMQETEATFAVFSRMVHKAEPSNGVRAVASSTNRILPDNTPSKARAVAAAVSPAPASPARRSGSKKTQVLKLADKGLPAEEIASQLTIPQGEIDLILNLNGRAAGC
jgi:DNA-binding NarL/FixJ family response regulator